MRASITLWALRPFRSPISFGSGRTSDTMRATVTLWALKLVASPERKNARQDHDKTHQTHWSILPKYTHGACDDARFSVKVLFLMA